MDSLETWTMLSAEGIVLDREQMRRLERFADEITYWNEKVNMISRRDAENLWERHIAHSLTILKYCNIPQKSRLLDVGTGGGFPGIPLAIARPDIFVTLTDSIAKKAKMTKMFAQHTGLKTIESLNIRVEMLATDKRHLNYFDVITARAVASASEVIGWTRKLLKKGGQYVFLKGGDLSGELDEARFHYPDAEITETQISMRGMAWFEQDEKKIVSVRF
ncbi:hypothetical protein MASR2M18_04080 [Ignavibacteria bacterium]|nr:16S rRNA (guanine(527)-N(7))-methyltransferase RsmG [Bacteroidota bacterium]MCZ2133436.1 16S rRNA (guanine(527)-N(7))-methyltransferase RsmG [Bacteroidota bacterium]